MAGANEDRRTGAFVAPLPGRGEGGESRADGIACRDESGSCDEGPRLEAKISALIDSAERGETAAADALFAALYAELHRLAERELARCGAGASLGDHQPPPRGVPRHGRAGRG